MRSKRLVHPWGGEGRGGAVLGSRPPSLGLLESAGSLIKLSAFCCRHSQTFCGMR